MPDWTRMLAFPVFNGYNKCNCVLGLVEIVAES